MSSPLHLRSILVPVDFSTSSEQALRQAKAFAAKFGGKITLVHVIESGRYVGEFTELETGMTEIPRRVEERLRMLVSDSGEPALFGNVEVRAGRPFHEISRAASELDSDLIVMASLGRSGAADGTSGQHRRASRPPRTVPGSRRARVAAPTERRGDLKRRANAKRHSKFREENRSAGVRLE